MRLQPDWPRAKPKRPTSFNIHTIIPAATLAASALLLHPEGALASRTVTESAKYYYAYRVVSSPEQRTSNGGETTAARTEVGNDEKIFVDYKSGNYRCPNLPVPASSIELYRRSLEAPWIKPGGRGDFGILEKIFGPERAYFTGRVVDVNEQDCIYFVQVGSGTKDDTQTLAVRPRQNPWIANEEGLAVSASGFVLFTVFLFASLSKLPALFNNKNGDKKQ